MNLRTGVKKSKSVETTGVKTSVNCNPEIPPLDRKILPYVIINRNLTFFHSSTQVAVLLFYRDDFHSLVLTQKISPRDLESHDGWKDSGLLEGEETEPKTRSVVNET